MDSLYETRDVTFSSRLRSANGMSPGLRKTYQDVQRSYSPNKKKYTTAPSSIKFSRPQTAETNVQPDSDYLVQRRIAIKSAHVGTPRIIHRPRSSIQNNPQLVEHFDQLKKEQKYQIQFLKYSRSNSPLTFMQRDQEVLSVQLKFQQQMKQWYAPKLPRLAKTGLNDPISENKQQIDEFRVQIIKELNKLSTIVLRINQRVQKAQKDDNYDIYGKSIFMNYLDYLQLKLDNFDPDYYERTQEELQQYIIDLISEEYQTQVRLGNKLADIYQQLIKFEKQCQHYYSCFFNEQQFVDDNIFKHRKNIKIVYLEDANFETDLAASINKNIEQINYNLEKLQNNAQTIVPNTQTRKMYDDIINNNKQYLEQVKTVKTFSQLQQIDQKYNKKLFIGDVLREKLK